MTGQTLLKIKDIRMINQKVLPKMGIAYTTGNLNGRSKDKRTNA